MTGVAVAQTVPAEVEDMLERTAIARENISLWVAPVDTGVPIVEWNSDVPRRPASVTKVITTGIGLLLLGENYCWRTEFSTNGSIHNGVLKGDLFIKAYGNPYLVEEDMRAMVAALRQRGISRIEGRVALDRSYYAKQTQMQNPDAFDGHGMEPYNAIPSALSINFRTVKVNFEVKGGGVRVTTTPPLKNLVIDNQMTLNKRKRCRGKKAFAPQLELHRPSHTLTVRGSMSRRCSKQQVTRVIGDAGDLFFAHFKRAWEAAGGTMNNTWVYGHAGGPTTLLYEGVSQPLHEQIAAMNKLSNNLMTRQLFLTIGAELTEPPATTSKGRGVVIQRLKKFGIDTRDLVIENGSGLSRRTQLTATQLGQFMVAMQYTPVASYFERSLSIAGVDGTLKRRLRGTPLAGNAVGKTGTLKGVKSLVGYLTSASGRKFVYVVLLNGRKAKTGRPLMDELMQWIYHSY